MKAKRRNVHRKISLKISWDWLPKAKRYDIQVLLSAFVDRLCCDFCRHRMTRQVQVYRLCFRAKVRILKGEVTRQTTRAPPRVRMVSCVFESSPSLLRRCTSKTLIGTLYYLKGPMIHSVGRLYVDYKRTENVSKSDLIYWGGGFGTVFELNRGLVSGAHCFGAL